MNTHDIELPPLPSGYPTYEFPDGAYDAEQMQDYARAAIEAYAKRIAELEAARIAYASEFAPDEDGNPDVGSIHENIRKLKVELKKSERNGSDKGNDNDNRQRRGSIVNNASASSEPEPCFCDRMYPDSNPDVSCGDCPTRDYKEPMKDSVDIDDFIAAFIARGDITKDAFLEARQWVRDTYYNPAEPVNMDLVRKWQAENGVKQDPDSREARMVVIRHDDDGKPTIWCDPEIADLVRALNDGGVETVGSCSGHGWRPGNIMLSDGRVLIICKDVDEAKGVVSHFPCINGEAPLDAEAVGGLSAEQLAEILSAYIKPEIIGEALEKLENAPWELSEPVKVDAEASVPSDDALDDALSNLEHDNYEQSYSGYKNRQADIALIRTALARYK